MFRKLISTSNDFTLTLVRLVLGVVFFAHGAQKMLGWFGGYGFYGTMGFLPRCCTSRRPLAFLAFARSFSAAWDCSLGCWAASPPSAF